MSTETQQEDGSAIQLRKSIQEIQSRSDIDLHSRARLIQQLMSEKWTEKQTEQRRIVEEEMARKRRAESGNCYRSASASSAASTSSNFSCCGPHNSRRRIEDSKAITLHHHRESEEEEQAGVCEEKEETNNVRGFGRSYHDEEEKILGCKHYQRGCKIRAPCCGELFTCRLCHDEATTDHTIDRKKIEEMMCLHCFELQPISQTCRKCTAQIAIYYCDVCKFFDDDKHKNIYHCPHCDICRIGKGLDIDFFHCMKCHACLHISLKEHKCIERSLDSNCPICADFLFTSTSPITHLNCGHWMHVQCLEEYMKTNYICPLCSKSLDDASLYFSLIDEWMQTQEMPSEYASKVSNILCSDCEQKSVAKYHFSYHKCAKCGSYNTKLISVEG